MGLRATKEDSALRAAYMALIERARNAESENERMRAAINRYFDVLERQQKSALGEDARELLAVMGLRVTKIDSIRQRLELAAYVPADSANSADARWREDVMILLAEIERLRAGAMEWADGHWHTTAFCDHVCDACPTCQT